MFKGNSVIIYIKISTIFIIKGVIDIYLNIYILFTTCILFLERGGGKPALINKLFAKSDIMA